jgi:hypothetical protein
VLAQPVSTTLPEPSAASARVEPVSSSTAVADSAVELPAAAAIPCGEEEGALPPDSLDRPDQLNLACKEGAGKELQT